MAFAMQHLEAAGFAHVHAAVPPPAPDWSREWLGRPKHLKPAVPSALEHAFNVLVSLRRQGVGEGQPSCRAVAAAFATVLQAFPHASGTPCIALSFSPVISGTSVEPTT